MFSAKSQKNPAVAQVYFDEHLSHNDYYNAGEIEVGHWIGTGALSLGRKNGGAVDRDAFLALCKNLHPDTGDALTVRQRAGRRIFYDFTCSAPKSVSLLAVVLGDNRIVEAHQAAARRGLLELEQFAKARVRKDGAQVDRPTANVVGAEFLHTSSRTLDPQLHIHFTLFNCTFDYTEDRWKALQAKEMYQANVYATEVYRNDLVRRLHELGYRTANARHGFEIEGVSKELCDRFSKRSKERDEAIAKMERRLGRKLSNNEIAHAVHQTRSRKLKGISSTAVRKLQLAEFSKEELSSLKAVQQAADGRGKDTTAPANVDQVMQFAIAHVFERASVVSEQELLRQALIEGRGRVEVSRLKECITDVGGFVRVGNDLSLRSILEKELSMIGMVNDGKDVLEPLHANFVFSPWLAEDQQTALSHILGSLDRFTGFRGLAGTGKSRTLMELSKALNEAGSEGLFCAPTAAASDVLRKEGFDSFTLQRLLVDSQLKDTLSERSVIVLDEAGAVGLSDMHALFSLALERGARVVLSGDTGQHPAVTAGDALRILEEHSQYSYGQLTTIRRQKHKEYLKAVKLAAKKQPQQAFDQLDAMGEVQEHSERLYQEAASAYLRTTQAGQSSLLVAPTWSEIESLTEEVRSSLKRNGVVCPQDQERPVLESLGWSEAEKQNVKRYNPGHILVFHGRSVGFSKHEVVAVMENIGDSLHVQRKDGTVRKLRLKRGGRVTFDVCESRTLAVAPGDKLLLQSNDARHRLINGQLVEVKSVEAGGSITLSDGRIIPPDYRQFTHGYAVTSHAAQGKTVDEVLLVASSRSLPAVNREQFYVSISRGRTRCRIFTDDKELLRDRLLKTAKRTAAVELVSLGAALTREGFTPPPQQKVAPNQAQTVEGVTQYSPTPTKKRQTMFQRLVATVRNWTTHLQFVGSKVRTEKLRQNQSIHHTQTSHIRKRGISI